MQLYHYKIFRHWFSTPELDKIYNEANLMQKWLDVEVALVEAQAELDLIPESAAQEIRKNARIELFDLDGLAKEVQKTGHELVPLIRALSEKCSPDNRGYVHWGATTQDILDTGAALLLKEAYPVLMTQLKSLIEKLSDLAKAHRDTLMAGRTHHVHALPMTFGFKVSVWVAELLRHLERLVQIQPRVLVGQLAGAVGTMAGFGSQGIGLEVQRLALHRLDLRVPPIVWHSARDGIAELMTLTGLIGGTLSKLSSELATLQTTEISELQEPIPKGTIGSSTMPHKRNPLGSELVVATCTMLENSVTASNAMMKTSHERDLACWLVEWVRLPEAICLLGSALNSTNQLISGLQVNKKQMLANLEKTQGLILSEAPMLELGRHIGREKAHDVIYEISMEAQETGKSFKELLLNNKIVAKHLTEEKIEELLSLQSYVGLSNIYVDNVTQLANSISSSTRVKPTRREELRVLASCAVDLYQDIQHLSGRTANLSLSGAYCLFPKPSVKIDSPAKLTLQIPQEQGKASLSVEIKAHVIRVEPSGNSFGVALNFVDLSRENELAIARCLLQKVNDTYHG